MAILLSFQQGSNHSSDIQFTYRDVISAFDQLECCLLLKGQSFWYTASLAFTWLPVYFYKQSVWVGGRKVDVNMEMFYTYVENEFCELGGLKTISKCDRSR